MSTMLVQRGMRGGSAQAGVTVGIWMNNIVFIIAILLLAQNRGLPPLNATTIMMAAAGGVFGNLVGRTISYLGVQRIGSARTTSLMLSQTLFALLFGVVLLNELLSPLSLMGMALVVIGIYWLSQERVRREETAATSEENAQAIKRRVIEGMVLAVLAGLAYSGADLFRKVALLQLPSALYASAIGGVAALVVQTLLVTVKREWREIRLLERKTWIVFALAGFASSIAVITLNTALGMAPIAIVSALYSTRVWFVIAMSPVLLGKEEKLSWVLVVSTILILSGTLIIIFY